ncbi:valine--tRNA ligase [Sesbania bispinosa]|nr:valine--tRNA ligase [Sesbania bispinosa]
MIGKKIAQQLGLTHDEGYMNFMNSIDEAKKICGFNGSAQDAAAAAPTEEHGTQQSEVGSTQMDFNKQK